MPRIEIEVTHPNRVMFPANGITKLHLADYYGEVADTMLPHLKDRPLTVQRFPRGIGENGFVQQDFADTLPNWMSGVEVDKEGGTLVHPLADRPQALRWLANQNCITLHVWQVLHTAVRHGRVPGLSRWLTGARDDPDPHCPRCGTHLRHGRIGGRMSFWCPHCQP